MLPPAPTLLDVPPPPRVDAPPPPPVDAPPSPPVVVAPPTAALDELDVDAPPVAPALEELTTDDDDDALAAPPVPDALDELPTPVELVASSMHSHARKRSPESSHTCRPSLPSAHVHGDEAPGVHDPAAAVSPLEHPRTSAADAMSAAQPSAPVAQDRNAGGARMLVHDIIRPRSPVLAGRGVSQWPGSHTSRVPSLCQLPATHTRPGAGAG